MYIKLLKEILEVGYTTITHVFWPILSACLLTSASCCLPPIEYALVYAFIYSISQSRREQHCMNHERLTAEECALQQPGVDLETVYGNHSHRLEERHTLFADQLYERGYIQAH